MPVFLRYTGYKIYFWANENGEPIHFHIAYGNPSANSTKIWILSDGSFMIAHNNGNIPKIVLNRIIKLMQSNIELYKRSWESYHGNVTYYK